MQQKLSIPLLRFIYLMSRKRKKRKSICVLRGARMTESDFIKYNAIANER